MTDYLLVDISNSYTKLAFASATRLSAPARLATIKLSSGVVTGLFCLLVLAASTQIFFLTAILPQVLPPLGVAPADVFRALGREVVAKPDAGRRDGQERRLHACLVHRLDAKLVVEHSGHQRHEGRAVEMDRANQFGMVALAQTHFFRQDLAAFGPAAERVALEYADAMTLSGREVSDALFARLRRFYDDDALVELTAIIAWENASSKFNRALRIPSQGLWKRRVMPSGS